MEKIDLFTRGGDFVTSVQIPVFNPKAEILLWGSRYFYYNESKNQYLEGLCFWVPSESKPQGE